MIAYKKEYKSVASSPILKFRLDYLLPLILGLLMDQFFVHDGNHLVGFGVGLPPSFLGAVPSLFNRLPLHLFLFVIFFDADVSMHPIYLVFFALVGIRSRLFVLSFGRECLLIGACASLELSVFLSQGV